MPQYIPSPAVNGFYVGPAFIHVYGLMYDNLLVLDAKYNLLPAVAEKWDALNPTTWRLTPAGLEIGPSRLKIVRMPSSVRIGAQCFMAG